MTHYEQDFYAWSVQQAELLKERNYSDLDLENLIEEIENIARSERRELVNRLAVLLVHLLKWQLQPERHSRSWRATIVEQRYRVNALLDDSPSLHTVLAGHIEKVYPRARVIASEETGLDSSRFPAHCPFTSDQILNMNWLPDAN